MSEALSAEFDVVAGWTAEVAADLGADYHLAAACRGSGNQAALAWLVDQLCTAGDQQALLGELRRVLTDSGRLGLLAFTALVDEVPDSPPGNHFPTPDGLRRLLRDAGFDIDTMAPAEGLGPSRDDWTDRMQVVQDELERRHGTEEVWRLAQHQSDLIGHLLDRQLVTGTLVVARPTSHRATGFPP